MEDHKHGEMDVKEHVKTFDGFMQFVSYTVIVLLVLVVFMAIFIT